MPCRHIWFADRHDRGLLSVDYRTNTKTTYHHIVHRCPKCGKERRIKAQYTKRLDR